MSTIAIIGILSNLAQAAYHIHRSLEADDPATRALETNLAFFNTVGIFMGIAGGFAGPGMSYAMAGVGSLTVVQAAQFLVGSVAIVTTTVLMSAATGLGGGSGGGGGGGGEDVSIDNHVFQEKHALDELGASQLEQESTLVQVVKDLFGGKTLLRTKPNGAVYQITTQIVGKISDAAEALTVKFFQYGSGKIVGKDSLHSQMRACGRGMLKWDFVKQQAR